MEESLTIEIQNDIVCPKCGWEGRKNECLTCNLGDIKGDYCLNCYIKWIDKNITKMVDAK